MSQKFEIPLTSANTLLNIAIAGVTYNLRLIYNQTLDSSACWLLDINDANNLPMVCGIPLVPGADMIGQYKYLNFGFILYCFTDGNRDAVPTFANLGTASHLYFETL